jgi:hypothetical protein
VPVDAEPVGQARQRLSKRTLSVAIVTTRPRSSNRNVAPFGTPARTRAAWSAFFAALRLSTSWRSWACSVAVTSWLTRPGLTAFEELASVPPLPPSVVPGSGGVSGATAPPESSRSLPPASIVWGDPKPACRPALNTSNFFWFTSLSANMTMNSTMSRVIMSA